MKAFRGLFNLFIVRENLCAEINILILEAVQCFCYLSFHMVADPSYCLSVLTIELIRLNCQ